MASKELNVKLKQRYDTASNWTTNNPVLLAGELGIESDTKKMKVGDGTTSWNSLAYMIATPELPNNIAYTDKSNEFTEPQKFSSRDGYIELGSMASINDNGIMKLVSAITVTEDGENIYNLIFPKKSGTIALLEDAQGASLISEDTNLMDLDAGLYTIQPKGTLPVKLYYNGSTTDAYVSIESGFLNVVKSSSSSTRQFFGDIYQSGQKLEGEAFDQRATHAIILGWGSSSRGYCSSTYLSGASPIATQDYVDSKSSKTIWREWN